MKDNLQNDPDIIQEASENSIKTDSALTSSLDSESNDDSTSN